MLSQFSPFNSGLSPLWVLVGLIAPAAMWLFLALLARPLRFIVWLGLTAVAEGIMFFCWEPTQLQTIAMMTLAPLVIGSTVLLLKGPDLLDCDDDGQQFTCRRCIS